MNDAERIKRERIKADLRIRGTTFSDIARALGVTPTAISSACVGRDRSYKIEAAIAEALATTVENIWPDRRHPTSREKMTKMD